MTITDIFRKRADHLVWTRLPDDHVLGADTGTNIDPDRAYFVVRLSEMYLGRSRTLWRKFYPLVHSFTSYGGSEQHSVAGPGQLQGLGETNLDRVLSLNIRLAGPTPFVGGDVSIVAGLYSVPGDDAAKALVDTVGLIAGLATLPANPIGQVTQVIKASVDSILRLGETTLRLGVNDTFIAEQPLRSGFHVGIGAPREEVDLSRLWLRDGRLVYGPDPIAGRPYSGSDYMVIQVQRRERREDWPALPQMAEHQARFNAILADDLLTPDNKRDRLAATWPQFQEMLQQSPHLTRYDASRIENDVAQDLQGRLQAMISRNPFETKAWGSDAVEERSPTAIDFAEVPEYPELFGSPAFAAGEREDR